jgi:hypothetical protein
MNSGRQKFVHDTDYSQGPQCRLAIVYEGYGLLSPPRFAKRFLKQTGAKAARLLAHYFSRN